MRCLWDKRCEAHGLSPLLPGASVPTRPASKVELYQKVLQYRAPADNLYNPSYNGELPKDKANRRLSSDEWEQLQSIVDCLGV
jgi:hypothetical protein